MSWKGIKQLFFGNTYGIVDKTSDETLHIEKAKNNDVTQELRETFEQLKRDKVVFKLHRVMEQGNGDTHSH